MTLDDAVASSVDWGALRHLFLQEQLISSQHLYDNVVESIGFLEPPPFFDLTEELSRADDPMIQEVEVTRISVLVLQFMKKNVYALTSAYPGMASEELIEAVTGCLIADTDHFEIDDVYPQPDLDSAVAAIFPRWWRHAEFVPVVLDATLVDRGMAVHCLPKMWV